MCQAAQEAGLPEKAGFSPADSILIVDESPNLPFRMHSELGVDESAGRIVQAIGKAPEQVQRCLASVITAVQRVDPEEGVSPSRSPPLAGGAISIQSALDALATEEPADTYATLPERTLRLLLRADETVMIYHATVAEDEQRLIFRLVDPTLALQAAYSRGYASLSMSGSLAALSDESGELRCQMPLFGLTLRETLTRKYASPFALRNQRSIYSTDTHGTYRDRGNYLERYAEHLLEYPSLCHQRLEALYRAAFAPSAEERGDDLGEKAHEYAFGRVSLSLVLQACGRGIRDEADCCAFALLDRRQDEYDWRRLLELGAYQVRRPEANVRDFHTEQAAVPAPAWDAALTEFTERVTMK